MATHRPDDALTGGKQYRAQADNYRLAKTRSGHRRSAAHLGRFMHPARSNARRPHEFPKKGFVAHGASGPARPLLDDSQIG
jgi:hypothetical protein